MNAKTLAEVLAKISDDNCFMHTFTSVESEDVGGGIALHVACGWGNLELVKVLVESGSDVNKPDGDRSTPLYMAALGGNLEVVQYLVSKGASSTKNNYGGTPAMAARHVGHAAVHDFLAGLGMT
jgi:ankyrin repeat protein